MPGRAPLQQRPHLYTGGSWSLTLVKRKSALPKQKRRGHGSGGGGWGAGEGLCAHIGRWPCRPLGLTERLAWRSTRRMPCVGQTPAGALCTPAGPHTNIWEAQCPADWQEAKLGLANLPPGARIHTGGSIATTISIVKMLPKRSAASRAQCMALHDELSSRGSLVSTYGKPHEPREESQSPQIAPSLCDLRRQDPLPSMS